MNTYLLLLILLLPLIANISVRTAYSKYSSIQSNFKLSGKDIARRILDANGLNEIRIVETRGNLSDNYNPSKKTISLSNGIYDSDSIAAVSVAAHEVGHAIQDKESYLFMRIRAKMVPVVNLTSKFSMVLIILGMFLEILNLYYIGIGLLSIGLIFQLITLPVEFDASRRAKNELERLNITSSDESVDIKRMLNAAAFTYVASFIAMAAQIFRLISLSDRH